MQATYSRVPTVKSRDSVLKQTYNVWSGPGPTTTFVRCLRLLDLDQLEDWPGISEHTFSTVHARQNLQARLKSVEWSLYRLFELWSPAETRDKLRPFFPPLTPLQSLNLRAALYRALTDLKKDGALRKAILLRKTMLDECQGEKFEELISAFAMTVLKKAAQTRNNVQLELACSKSLNRQQEAHLLPLIIAHHRSLRQQVSQRCKIKEHAQVYNGLLAQRRASIENRRARLKKLSVPEAGENGGISHETSSSWVGDDRWIEILVSGPKRPEDHFLEAPFEEGWNAALNGSSIYVGHQTNLFGGLNQRIADQKTRLRKWKTIAASLRNAQAPNQNASPAQSWAKEDDSEMLQFDRHQSLQLTNTVLPPRSVDRQSPTESNHKTLLASLEADLAVLGKRDAAKQVRARGQRQNDPYQLPKHTSKTSPLLGVFTPVSHNNDESSATGPILPEDTLAGSLKHTYTAPQRVESMPAGISTPIHSRTLNRFSHRIDGNKDHEECVTAQSTMQPTLSTSENSFGTKTIPPRKVRTETMSGRHKTVQRSSTTNTSVSASVSAKDDEHESEGQTELFAAELPVKSSKSEIELTTKDLNRMRSIAPIPTLLERTRQSMSLLPNPADRARLRSSEDRASSKQMRLSQTFPINQFETPCKEKRSGTSQLGTISTQSGSSTPRDELFSDAAAYDSVFKSRPRIALSPALSPNRSGIGLDSMLEEGLADLTLETVV